MPKIPSKQAPENLRPYLFHGVDLHYDDTNKQAKGTCPFCNRDDKFEVNIETSQAGCFHGSCSNGYNKHSFLGELHKASENQTRIEDYNELADDRKLLHADTLLNWGLCKSSITDHWLVPAYSLKNKKLTLSQLYKYFVGERGLLIPTPTLGHQLFGLNLYDPDKSEVFLVEGFWDAMALWETLKMTKVQEDGSFSSTSNINKSLLADVNVLAVPGCKTFFDYWSGLFSNKVVNICFDNDHPKEDRPPAGFNGMKRIAGILSSDANPPEKINYLRWGEEGYDLDLPYGMDVRDLLTTGESTTKKRIENLPEVLNRLAIVPKEMLVAKAKSRSSGNQLHCLDCESYKRLTNAWRKALKWTGGLNSALAVMLASAMSTNLIGEQLWFKILSPPSGGKTTLLEGLSVNKKHVVSKDTIRGFYSGWISKDGKDNSIAAQVKGKTLATKDGDTLLKSPNMLQILSEARGLYDRCGRTHYRNTVSQTYEGHRMTWLLCGTNALREIDDSELGARFLDCVVMDEIDEEFEDDVAWRVANQEANAMLTESNGDPENQNPESLTKAMQLTGGYLGYLKENAESLLNKTTIDADILRRCTRYARFIAFMRARQAKNRSNDDGEETREFSARLVKQLVRLCRCLVVVMNRKYPDKNVMNIVYKVMMDTSRGQTLEIVKRLYEEDEGLAANAITVYTGMTDTETGKRLRFLHKIKVVKRIEIVVETKSGKIRKQRRWDLTDSIRKLYEMVKGE